MGDWYVNGVKWTGAIKTVGASGKDYTTLGAAVTANKNVADTLYLVDAGTYTESAISGGTKRAIVRGLGDDATGVVLNFTAGQNCAAFTPGYVTQYHILENVKLNSTSVNVGMTGGYIDAGGVDYIVNKCILGSSSINKYSSGVYAGSTGGGPYYRFKYTDIYRGSDNSFNGGHLTQLNLSRVYLTKVAYYSTWRVPNCTGSLAEDDKAAIGTGGYGYASGDFIVTYEEEFVPKIITVIG